MITLVLGCYHYEEISTELMNPTEYKYIKNFSFVPSVGEI